jgi:alkylation response protein AidB-like acyl-CoA dehydrogenase
MAHSPVALDWPELLQRLRERSAALETVADFPLEQLGWLAQAGVMRWGVPTEFGGVIQSPGEMLAAYMDLAEACLVTTFVLTQRNAAVQRIVDSANPTFPAEALPGIARGESFVTVGISHLTTSRQHLARPAVTVRPEGEEIVLAGEVPWVTGAAHAACIVTGGVDDLGRQWLVAAPTTLPGVESGPPESLLALSASGTSRVTLRDVRLPRRMVLAGPAELGQPSSAGGSNGVSSAGSGKGSGSGTGSLGTSALAVGLARRAIGLIELESSRRPELSAAADHLRREQETLAKELLESAQSTRPDACQSPESIREAANSLALRSTQALLAASKGAGFVSGHPAERAVREAMFFLVWSCPRPVVAAALREFACLAG